MGILKTDEIQIHDYTFGELSLDKKFTKKDVKNFTLGQLKIEANGLPSSTEIKQERVHESQSAFAISSVVRKHRGILQQENDEYEQRISNEVAMRLEKVQQQAYDKGFELGRKEGHEVSYKESQVQLDEHLSVFKTQLDDLKNDMSNLYNKSKDDILKMVKNLTKWVTLKEVNEEKYLSRLLEKLIYEINQTQNLVIHVNESSFNEIPDVLSLVEEKVGSLNNVRVEIDSKMTARGIRLESESQIIDASLDAQFETIENLFKKLDLNES